MGYEVKSGIVHFIGATKQVSERFSKRELVIEIADNPKYPQFVQFEATGDRCERLDGVKRGDEVELEFNLRGREWKSPSGEVKFFNTLDVWKVKVIKAAPAPIDGGEALPF